MGTFLQFALLKSLVCVLAATGSTALQPLARRDFLPGDWTLAQHGSTGVAAMQLGVVSETKAVIYDKVEHNPLSTNTSFIWAAEYDLTTDAVRPLHPVSNSWCAAGAHLSNGTLVNTGGNPVLLTGDTDGLQGLRLFTPCDDDNCDLFEDPVRVRLASDRWYPASVRVDDGSIMIFGGSVVGAVYNNVTVNNPSYEFYPPKNIHGFNGLPVPNKFLNDSLNANHFPIMWVLPDGNLFVAANTQAMIFDWKKNVEKRLPDLPNGIRVNSPFTAATAFLPLSPDNDYRAEVLICGGSNTSDTVVYTTYSSQTPASNQCSRMALDEEGIAEGWKVEHMPQARFMGEAILLPDGRVLILNGAGTGISGYNWVKDPVGNSNADHPVLQAVIYDPSAPAGSRFSQEGVPISTIPRMYHSTATLTPNATIMIAGSNPNSDVTLNITYPTEYRVEWLSPSYMNHVRPTYTGLPATIDFGTTFVLTVTLPQSFSQVKVAVIDLGFATHGVHMDHRLVYLAARVSSDGTSITIHAPPNARVYPPGPGYLYVVADGVPSFGHKTLIGTGASPPVDEGAIANLLEYTPGPQPWTQVQ